VIDYKNKIIFVHIHKAAGKSLCRSLERNLFPQLINNSEFIYYQYKKRFSKKHIVYENNIIKKHSSALEYKKYIGNDFKKYFKFAFSRNPYDWQVSMFRYMKEHINHKQHNIVKDFNFDEYIEWRCSEDLNYQSDYILDNNKNIIVDFIGKVENIYEDMNEVSKLANYNFKIPHVNKSNLMKNNDLHNKSTIAMINKYFEIDFEVFNYKKL